MREASQRSIRLLVDLQGCQTAGSARRGVGRYSKSLFLELARSGEPREVFGLVSETLHRQIHWRDVPGRRLLRQGALPDWGVPRDFEGGERDSLDAALSAAFAATVRPDLIHISHVFEGFHERVAAPVVAQRPAGQVLSATLYDLIPLRFKEHYFQDRRFEAWYHHRLQILRRADLLLALSEATRRDAIELLGLDPERIATIHGGVAEAFRPPDDPQAARAGVRARHGLTRDRFILYTGGDDHRKNIVGALAGFAALPTPLRSRTHLVIVGAFAPERLAALDATACGLGLAGDDVLFTGHVPLDDLVALYGSCDAFVFPSLYEGLGLPVIEAMACGAPVIGSDNSSIREVIARTDALFDPERPQDVARALVRVLDDPGCSDALRVHGRMRSQAFTWRATAEKALEAFDEALARKRTSGVRAAASGWLPRPRIAMLTPLPPARSGIADYNARFLPFLAEHFDIDLYVAQDAVSDPQTKAAFRIFPATSFEDNAHAYGAILYEVGNSEFHAHMLALMERFPGILCLHDAYLGGLMAYLQLTLGARDRLEREMIEGHAGAARRLMAPCAENPDPFGAAIADLPAIGSLLKAARGIISHTAFNLETARRFHPEGFPGPFQVIPQMTPQVPGWTAEQRAEARAALGIAPDAFIVATFGHVVWTKGGDLLLEGFERSGLAPSGRGRLIYVGELAEDDWARALGERIAASSAADRVSVTGYVSDELYATYLRIADLAIQLRTNSRGGSSKSVLDCLSHGLPLAVNDAASSLDYPDDVVIKLPAGPSAEAIGDMIRTLAAAPEMLAEKASRGPAYTRAHHDPRRCAEQYAAAIRACMDRDTAARGRSAIAGLGAHLAGCPDVSAAARKAARFIDERPVPVWERARVVIDASVIADNDHATGIQRVVREIVKSGYLSARPDFEAVAVFRRDDDLVEAQDWLQRLGLLLPFERERAPAVIDFRPDDHLLMLDSSWAAFDRFEASFTRARARGVPVSTVVYDLLPLRLPEGHFGPGGMEWFRTWLHQAIARSDNLVCISRATADDLIDYIGTRGLGRPGLRIGHWPLGSSLPSAADPDALEGGGILPARFALMVGTIEPRKNHALALDAFERLWQAGHDLPLVIAGKAGWLVDDLMERLRTHPERGRRLVLLEGLGDGAIAHLYRSATVLLFLSKGEGFGLPLVEAAQFGLPIICSDIAVFREIAGAHATYADISGPERLADGIVQWLGMAAQGRAPQSVGMRVLTWAESAERLFDLLQGDAWYWEQPVDTVP